MKKLIKHSLLLVLAISSLCLTVFGCNSGNGNTVNVPPTEQTTPTEDQESQEQQPEENPSDDQPSKDDNPTEQQPSQGGSELSGGLVDMGNFESKH